jgi:hypothetical protein
MVYAAAAWFGKSLKYGLKVKFSGQFLELVNRNGEWTNFSLLLVGGWVQPSAAQRVWKPSASLELLAQGRE